MTRVPQITTDVDSAATLLKNGAIVAIPTETVYGLAALVHQEAAVMRIYSVKGRPTHHPLIVHVAKDFDLDKWGVFSSTARLLASEFWPGPLTLLVKRTAHVPDWVTGGRVTVALRVPQHPMCQELLGLIPDALVAPSANRFGRVSPTTAQHVLSDLGSDVDLILDGGPCDIGVESTIVDCTKDSLQILRPGAISAMDIFTLTGRTLSDGIGESRAPGMMLSHYSPTAIVELYESQDEALLRASQLSEMGTTYQHLYFENVNEYALRLYDELRMADIKGVKIVLAVLPEPTGIGIALRDRLKKASHRQS